MDFYRDPFYDYKAYHKFIQKGNYRKAYQCLENLLAAYPNEQEFLVDMVNLCYDHCRDAELAKPWMRKLIQARRSYGEDYLLLARMEMETGQLQEARQLVAQAKKMRSMHSDARGLKAMIKSLDAEINAVEVQAENAKTMQKLAKAIDREKASAEEKAKQAPARKQRRSSRCGGDAAAVQDDDNKQATPIPAETSESTPTIAPSATTDLPASPPATTPSYRLPVKFMSAVAEDVSEFAAQPFSTLPDVRLWLAYNLLSIQREFGELLCLSAMHGVEKYWHQIETVKKVLKYFRGRVLLCDEVGLGKTIEAGMIVKEYLMRGMAKNVLILTPPSLVSQWREEMAEKFGLSFHTSEDDKETVDGEDLWKKNLLIASINLAKGQKCLPLVTREFYDIVVVDEAHRLRNRNTLAWKLVNQLQKKFILLLTATPVQNNLVEIFNLITLLKPGQFKTETLFKKEYIKRGDARTPVNRDKLRALLRDVMIRNTRSVIHMKLPKRFATTMRLTPSPEEAEAYVGLQQYLRGKSVNKQTAYLLLREAGSSPQALLDSLLRFRQNKALRQIIAAIERSPGCCKGQALLEILSKNNNEKVLIFAQYRKSVDYIVGLLAQHGIGHVCFRGDMSAKEKNEAIARFRDAVPVLVSTESGGEGKNLQFARTIVNFDLPWNPMRIEQRIGRLHRIGQTRDVFIFNLAVHGTIEDSILEILDRKINMFEMVVGEIEPILGYVSQEDDFEDIVLSIWLESGTPEEADVSFARLGEDLLKAKNEYLKNKLLDEKIFGDDYEA